MRELIKVTVKDVQKKEYVCDLTVSFIDKEDGEEVTLREAIYLGTWDKKSEKWGPSSPEEEEYARQSIRAFYGLEYGELEQLMGTTLEYYLDDTDYKLYKDKGTNLMPVEMDKEGVEGRIVEVVQTARKIQIIADYCEQEDGTFKYQRIPANFNFTVGSGANQEVNLKRKKLAKKELMGIIKNKSITLDNLEDLVDLEIEATVETFKNNQGKEIAFLKASRIA